MGNRIIFTSKSKKSIDTGKIPSSVEVLVQTDDSSNMDDFRNWASDTNALISLNKTLQAEGIGNTDSGSQYYNRYGSSTLYQTKLIPNTDYAGRSVAAQGDNRSWIRKDYIENYKITVRSALDKSKTIFSITTFTQPEQVITVVIPTVGGLAGAQPPQSNVLGNSPQLPSSFNGSYLRKLTTSAGNAAGATSLVVASIYGNAVSSYGLRTGSSVSGNGIPDNTFIGAAYAVGTSTIPLVDDQGNPVSITSDIKNDIIYIESNDDIILGLPHYNTPANGSNARFAVNVNEDGIVMEINIVNPGDGYSASNQTTTNKLIIPGSFVGGDDGENDISITSYVLNTYAVTVTSTDFQEKNININDYVSSEETGIDTFTYSGTAAGTITKTATMVKGETSITVNTATLLVAGMLVTSSTGFGIPNNTIIGSSYVSGSTTVPLTTLNGVTPQKVTLTYASAINVSFSYSSTFVSVTGTTTVGTGSGATFIVTKNTNNTYNVFPAGSGANYSAGAQILITGNKIGGVSGINDLTIVVQKVLDKFPAGTKITFFEKSLTNPGYYDLYFSSLPRAGVTLAKIATSSGNISGSNTLNVTSATSITSGMLVTSTTTGIPADTYVGNNYVSGSTVIPLTELDGSTTVTLTGNLNNASLTFTAATILTNGDGLVFSRSNNSFWTQLNSGSIFEGIPVNYVAWYRGSQFTTKRYGVTLLPPSNTSDKYRLYTQIFRIDTIVDLRTAITVNSDWSLYIQVGRTEPKWETIVVTSTNIESSYTGSDGKVHYIFNIFTQYPSKYSWDLLNESITYCYVYRTIMSGIDSSYITQMVPFNKAFLWSEFIWLAPKVVTIPVSNTATTTLGGVFKDSTATNTFRYFDKDSYSMYFRTWKDLIKDSDLLTNTSSQIQLNSTATDQKYIYAQPRTITFRSAINQYTYINIDTGTLYLGTSPATNSNIDYVNNIIRLDTTINYAPVAPGVYTYSYGRQVLYYQYYAWNYFSDNLTLDTAYGNPTTLSVPYKFIATVPYYHPVNIISSGILNAVVISKEAHGLQSGDPILFENPSTSGMSSGSLSVRGIISGTTYYVSATNLTLNSFEFSATRGGASFISSSTQNIIKYMYCPPQLTSNITAVQTTSISICGMHGLVDKLTYKIQSGTTEPVQLQDVYYYIKREYPNLENLGNNGSVKYIKFDNEIMSFTSYSVDGNNRFTFSGIQRGQLGTTASSHNIGSTISIVFDLWSPTGTYVSNNLFNVDGTLKSNVALTYQNNWTYTREFPDYGGTNGLLYYGIGRRDSTAPSRWETALYGPGYFAPGTLSFVSVDNLDSNRTAGTYSGRSGTTNAQGSGATFDITISNDTNKTVSAVVTSGGINYKLGEKITIAASSIGNTGSALILTATNLNFGTLYAGMNLGQPAISKTISKSPYYQALYKENSLIKYYTEPAPVGQRSYEDLYGAANQSLIKTRNTTTGIPDDTTPYYNVRTSADTILLQASRDQYYSLLSASSKRPKYLGAATIANNNTIVVNDAIGIGVGDTVYGPGISLDGAVVSSITGTKYYSLETRNGVTNQGTGVYTKTSGRWAWDADVYSNFGYTTNVYAAAKAQSIYTYIMFGLNSDPITDGSYASIDYAWYLTWGGNLYIYENGGYVTSYGTYTTTTNLRVEYDGTNVVYYKDGVAQRTVARSVGSKLYFDSSFVYGGLKNVEFGQTGLSENDYSASIKLRTKRVLIKDIEIIKYELINDASLGYCARISIPNSYGISQNLGSIPYKYYISEIRFDYVDPIYVNFFKTFLFSADTYSAPILKTEINNANGYLLLYVNNLNLTTSESKEKFDSSLYALKAKLNIVSFNDFNLNPEQIRLGSSLSLSSKSVDVGSTAGIVQGMMVTNYNSGGLSSYPGEVSNNTIVQTIDSDTNLTLNNFPSASGLSSLKFTSNISYPIGTSYTFDPIPNLYKNTRYLLDAAKPVYFTSKWNINQTLLNLYFSPDVNDPSTSINYPINIDSPLRYYAVDSGDRLIYNISNISFNSGSSYLTRSTTDSSFANIAVDQKIYFTNISAGISLTENTPYYIVYVLGSDIRISNTLGGSPLNISSGTSLSNLSLKFRRVYDSGIDRNILRTSLQYFDYQTQVNVADIPSGDGVIKTIAANGGNINSSSLTVTNSANIVAGKYVVSDTVGIPNLTVVGSNYISGSTTVPLTTVSGIPVNITANMSGSTIIFTNASARIYNYDGTTYNTYPYIGVALTPSTYGVPTESSGVLAQIPSPAYSDQIQLTFAKNTLPQELYPYAKIEIYYPTLILSQSISNNDTIVKINGTIPNGYPEIGNIKIGSERIYYGYRTSTYFGDCIIKFVHTSGDSVSYSPNYSIKPEASIQNGCPQNNNTKLIVMSSTPSTGVGYSPSVNPQTIYVSGFELDRDSTNSISFPSNSKYYISSDKIDGTKEVTVNRISNSIVIPGGTILSTLNDGDEIVLNSNFGVGSGYKIVNLYNASTLQINKPSITSTNNEYRRLFVCDSDIISGLNDNLIDNALSFNGGKGIKYVGLSGCTDFKPVKCTKIKYVTATANKYSSQISLADNIAASTLTLTGLNNYYSSGSTKASAVKSVLQIEGEDYEIKSISGRIVTLTQPLKQKLRYRDTVTYKSDVYVPEFERVTGVKSLIYGPQKAVFYDRYRAAQVSTSWLGYNSATNRYRWMLTFTYGVPSGIVVGDLISSNLNYNYYNVTAAPSSSESGTTTSATQIIVSAGTTTAPTNSTNQSIIYISKNNGYISRDFESASMQLGGFKNASRQQVIPTQVIAEATNGALSDIEAVSTRATRDIFTSSLGEVLGRFLFKQKNFSSSNRPNLWRNSITSPSGMTVQTGNVISYLINGEPNFITYQINGNKIFYGNSSTWNSYTATGTTVFNNIGFDSANARLLYACNNSKIRYASSSTPATQTEITVTGSPGTMSYVTYVGGYYFAANDTGGLYYASSIAGTWYPIITGNTSKVVGVYYDEFKYIVLHERIVGGSISYKNFVFPSITGTSMNISTSSDAIRGLTNIFATKKSVSNVYGFGKILETGFAAFDGTTYSESILEVYEYENFSDFTTDPVSDDYQANGITFNYGQFFAFGKQISTNKQFIKYSSNGRNWVDCDISNYLISTDVITNVIYGGFNTYIAIVWNSVSSTNKILVSNVKSIGTSNLLASDLLPSGSYRLIENSESVTLYKYKTASTSQEGNLLIWNNTTSQLVWLKNAFGSPLRSNEFTDYKALAAENFTMYSKNSKLLPNFRSIADSNGATRPVTIYNEQLPLGIATIATSGSGYQYGTYTGVELLNGSTPDYGSSSNRATCTIQVDDTGKIISATVDTAGDYYPSNSSISLVNNTGILSSDVNLKLNSTRSVNKSGITFATADVVTYTKTGSSWVASSSSLTVTSGTNIVAGQEVTATNLTGGQYYVSSSYTPTNDSTSIPIVNATGVPATLPATGNTNVSLTFKLYYITIPAGSNVSGITRGMSVSGGTLQTSTIVLSNYSASDLTGPIKIPISRLPAGNFNTTLTFNIIGTQGSLTTAQTRLDSSTFSTNGILTGSTGYCVLYRNILNGIEFIAMFFNDQGVLIDSISGLSASEVLHLSRTEMFAQAL